MKTMVGIKDIKVGLDIYERWISNPFNSFLSEQSIQDKFSDILQNIQQGYSPIIIAEKLALAGEYNFTQTFV